MRNLLHYDAKELLNTGGGASRSFNKETLGSDCAVRVCTSEGAPNEHPLSTHSAPIGTSRKPAGIKAVIRCMAAMFIMLFTLGVGNAWGAGETISSLTLASNASGKTYPQTGKRYYVYAENPNTTSSYKDEIIFWTHGSSTNAWQIKQTTAITTGTSGTVPNDALIVRIVVENDKPYIEAFIDNAYKKLFFHKASTSYLVASNGSTNAAYVYYEPNWSFAYDGSTWQLSGTKYASTSATATTETKVCAKYTREKISGTNVWLKFNTTSTPLATDVKANPSGTSEAPSHTKWKFVEVPNTWYYSATPSPSGYADATVEVSTNGTNWYNSIGTTSTTEENVHLYFRASEAPEGYEFVGWYTANDVLLSESRTYDAEMSGTGTSSNPTTFNYVAVYRQTKTVYYSLKGVVKSGQEERGSVKVSLNGTDWYDSPNGEVIGSVVTGSSKPHITVYFKAIPSSASYTPDNFDYLYPAVTPTRVTKLGASNFPPDPLTGVVEASFEIKNANNHLTEANACLIDLKGVFGKAAQYKGVVAMTTSSPANAGTVKVALTQAGLASATTETAVASVAVAEEATEATKALWFEATVNNTDPGRYRFNGWYDVADTTGATVLSTLATGWNKGVTATFGESVAHNTLTLFGDFEESTQKYYRTEVAAVPSNGGTVKSGFTSTPTEASETGSAYSFDNSINKTAYYTAAAAEGFEFQGWSTTPSSCGIINGATSTAYSKQIAVSSTNSEMPTTLKMFAIFRSVTDDEAQVRNAANEIIYSGDLSSALTYAGGKKVELLKSVALSDGFTFTTPRTIDLNGFDITGSTATVNMGAAGDELKFVNSDECRGKIDLTITTAQAITVEKGHLVIDAATIEVSSTQTTGTTGIVVNSANAALTVTNGDVLVTAPENVYAVVSNAGTTTINGSAELVAHALYTNAEAYALKRVGGTVVINGGGFRGSDQDIYGEITVNGGYFAHNEGLNVSEPYVISEEVPTGLKFSVNDYRYMVINQNSSIYPWFVVLSKNNDNQLVARQNFSTLESAITYANNNAGDDLVKTIMMYKDYTLPAGNYTIPTDVTLVVPYSANQTDAKPHIDRILGDEIPSSAYCTLTLADGVHIDVFGAIEVGGAQTGGTETSSTLARPGGDTYGLMVMNGNSSITLNDGANFYAWGFVQGTGTIDARRGSVVREHFQINDWKTLVPTCFMAVGGSIDYQLHVLPVNQYFIQNVEVKTTYRPGSRLYGQVCAFVLGFNLAFNDVGIIGVKYSDAEKAAAAEKEETLEDDVAIFLMNNEDESDDTWVRKSYDVANDVQLYEVNNSAYLGSLRMVVDFSDSPINLTSIGFGEQSELDVDSRDFALPLTNNFKIHLLTGNLIVTQNTELLPGSEIEIDKKSTMTINSSQTLYLYDADQWGAYVSKDADGEGKIPFGYGSEIVYRPGGLQHHRTLTPAGMGDALLNVHGTVDVKGYLKTTTGDKVAYNATKTDGVVSFEHESVSPATEGGAAIISTVADAGTIIFSTQAQAVTNGTQYYHYLWQVTDPLTTTSTVYYYGNHVISALLKNEGGTPSPTANTAAGKSFCYIDFDGDGMGEWKCLTDDGCFVKDENNVYYIKPQAYVPLGKDTKPTAESDHTYRDHYAGTNKIFILLDECQWWEVEPVEGHPELFECKHPDNTTFYYWDGTKWAEKKYKVEWMDWDGSERIYKNKVGEWVNYYYVTYHTTPEWFGSTPARLADDNYTYEFTGWSPTPAPVEEDVVYTATYEKKVRSYQITFKDKAGNVIEIQNVDYGETPSCQTYTLAADEQWSPAIGIVTKNQDYQVQDKNPGPFTITFVNWNGVVLKTATNVAKNTSAEAVAALYNIAAPTKPATQDETYTFTGWNPTIVEATADAVYTATFSVTPTTYAIKFYEEDGTTQIGATQNLEYGAMPSVPEYSKDPTDEESYTLSWRDGEDKAILVGVATKDQSYYAHFAATTRQYEVRWINEKGEVFDAQSLTYGSTPTYHGVTPTQAADAAYRYEFAGLWKDESGTEYDGSAWATVAGNQTYTAQFTPHSIEPLVIENAQTVSDNQEVVEVRITTTGSLNVTGKITTDYLILESDGSTASGQLTGGAGRISISGNAFFDLMINAKNHKWYGVAVPWQVDATSGISVNGKTLVLGKDFDIIYYDGAKRAKEGPKKCWKYVEDDGDKTLQPGRLYMIGLMMDAPQGIRFKKKAQAALLTTHTSVEAHPQTTGDVKDANWNGVANPALFHAFVNPGVIAAQVYDGENGYDEILLSDAKFVVGQGAFVQAPADKSIVVNTSDTYPASAPRRAKAEEAPLYDVRIAPAEAEYTDRLFVTVDDEKEVDTYVIGKDLAKLGVSKSVAQMWINRYNTELCLNTMAPVNGVAEYPLGIYAPKAGEYTITIHNSQFTIQNEVYLTLNGEAIWNLSDAAYTGTFDAGTTGAYGLRISARAPQIATGVDEAVVDAKGETRKVLIDNKVYIIRGEKVYTVDGQLVK